jgi:hypothetical protein
MLADTAQVGRRRLAQASQATLGQDGLGAPGIGQAGAPLNKLVADQPVDEPGHAALAQDHLLGEWPHAHPPSRCLGKGQQRVVLGDRQVVLEAQLLVQAA